MTTTAHTRDQQTAQRLRQFGLREVVALTTCLALTLGLFRQSHGGVAVAIGLICTLATMLWQAKRVDHPADVPLQFQSAALAVATLVVEWFAAWLWGFTGSAYYLLFVVIGLVRFICLCAAGIHAFDELVRIIAHEPLPWEEQGARVGLTGRLAIAVLWMPLLFAWPLTDLGTIHIAKLVGAKAVIADVKKPAGRDKRTPALARLDQRGVVTSMRGGEYEFHSRTANYRLQYHTTTGWDFYVGTGTMDWTRIDRWQP